LNWDALPLSQWEDTMAKAAAHNLPLALDKCCTAIGLPEDKAKSKRGKYLISKLCKPQKGGLRLHDRVLLREMYEYCKQDVVAERAIDKKLSDLIPSERKLWELDQKINIRGVYIDSENVDHAIVVLTQIMAQLKQECLEKSNQMLASTNSRPQVFKYLEDVHGWKMPGYKKSDVNAALKNPALPAGAADILDIRQREGKTSTAKYKKLQMIKAKDGRAHGLLQFHAASTGRWGGRMFQPHNLPRPDIELAAFADKIISTFQFRDANVLPQFFGEPMSCMSTALRGMIISPPGKVLYVGDYSQIEARALVWLAQQLDVLGIFAEGTDVYRHTAAKIYRCHIDEVTSEQRFIGKIATLALGYQGGYKAFLKMAADFGVEDMDEDFAENIKLDWRNENPEIVSFWNALEQAAIAAVLSPGEVITIGDEDYTGLRNIKFVMGNHFLQLILPSGRSLYYFHPVVIEGDFGDQMFYWGTDSFTKQWSRLSMYGGKWAQHVAEGVCRDLLALSMADLEDEGFDMILSVHDENIAEREPGHTDAFREIMLRQPAWSHGLPVGVDIFTAERYRK
jgi:DNA polymerase